jgi:ABC-type multidrug transport system fused ATPase/permease subunit
MVRGVTKHSGVAGVAVPTALVLLDAASRLALPAALLALSRGHADAAVLASFGSAAASGVRGVLLGYWTERAVVHLWRRTVDAARGQLPAALRVREEGEVTALVTAVREVAILEARTVPQLAALGLALAAVAAAVAALLGPAWIAFGAVAAVALGSLAALGRKRLLRAYERAWEELGNAARDTGVLISAGAELRAHGREESFAAALLDEIERMGKEERLVTAWEAIVGLLPAGLAVAAVAAPVRAGAAWAAAIVGPTSHLADVGILGGAALLLGLSLVHAQENLARARPLRRTLDAFLAGSPGAPSPPRGGDRPVPRSLALAAISFDGVSMVHPGASHATPRGFAHLWSERRGLALTGDNGVGKSTLVLALLGLIGPTRGRITIDEVPLDEIDLADFRRRIAYLPQGAFVAPGESVAWHLRLLAGGPISDERLDAALEEVSLLAVLREHAARSGKVPRDVLAGELSGGERQRMHLCRVLLHDAELVILDEPEVALDGAGRDLVRRLLDRLAGDRKVLIIAHDASLVPSSYERVPCVRGHASEAAELPEDGQRGTLRAAKSSASRRLP